MSVMDVSVKFYNNDTGTAGAVVVDGRSRVFGVQVSRGTGENGKVDLHNVNDVDDIDPANKLIEFECGNSTNSDDCPFLFLMPGQTSVLFDTGITAVFSAAGNPNSISVIYQT